jgi:uncharacterized membrane protein
MLNRDALSRFSIYVYGLSSATVGVMDFIWGDFDLAHQPIQAFGGHIPGREILAHITAVWMIAAGLAVLWRRSAPAGGAALAIIYLVFAIFWLPRFYTAPHYLGFRIPVFIGVAAGLGIELIAFAGGALVWALLSTRRSSRPRMVFITRWIFGLCAIDFGVNHLDSVADNLGYVPKWLPLGQAFWVIVTGICFVLAGLAILSRVQDVLAARLLALMFLAFNIFSLPQFIFADPKDHAAWGGNAINLTFVGASLIFADAIASHRKQVEPRVQKQPGLNAASDVTSQVELS